MEISQEFLILTGTLIPLVNFIFLVCVVIYINIVNKRLNKLFQINAMNIIDASEAVFKRMDYIIRWQKLIARMINEDRDNLKSHDKKIDRLIDVALKLEKVLPKDQEQPHQ